MTGPTTIGQCRACLARPRTIEPSSGACTDCLRRHTRRWLALCIRAREDLVFRASVRAYLSDRSRQVFDKMFGPPFSVVP